MKVHQSGSESGPGPGRDSGGEDGFTVVEVLVSFAIAAIGMLLALQIAGETMGSLRRSARLDTEADEAEGICLRRVASGPLSAGLAEGRFADGRPWTLTVSDVRAVLPAHRGPPVWRLVLTRGGPEGPAVYTTLLPGKPDA
ncbi:Tfp pilus assembly protein FimT/FimU [Methylobacterium sp. J-076]|uniref:pilus assembly FimT family protein n=1 Tax=Methylobacterium sp. J-076 TaxID=2836655 RepID=UPI001FBBE4B1|nr:prepilin-type N-terminal cleavage/methylation domain-containing protein [Methylobacterium sp. J-076]MCJ2015120.1 prepilin-type N-terminal cleavage/methylation domain-containing protein [Methylobacterium sp. J-076]